MNPLNWAVRGEIKEARGSAKPTRSPGWPTAAAVQPLNGLPVEVTARRPQGVAYVVDGSRVFVVVRKDGMAEADKSVGLRNDLAVPRAIGRFGFGFLSESAAARIKDVA
jgi:hypothetical protein